MTEERTNRRKLASAAAVASVSLLVASGVAWAGARGGASMHGVARRGVSHSYPDEGTLF